MASLPKQSFDSFWNIAEFRLDLMIAELLEGEQEVVGSTRRPAWESSAKGKVVHKFVFLKIVSHW